MLYKYYANHILKNYKLGNVFGLLVSKLVYLHRKTLRWIKNFCIKY